MPDESRSLRPEERQTVTLMGLLLSEARAVVMGAGDSMRASQLRILTAVPPDGIAVSDLALRVEMTKQGCGQFVDKLEGRGLLQTGPDPDDRRRRLVTRTAAGDASVRRHGARLRALERRWAGRVGERRYATFRRVLEDLTLDR